MSNRQQPRGEPRLSSVLDALTGRRLPGGCDDCCAYQTVELVDSIYVMTVHHDQTCPYYRGDTR